MRTSFFPSLRLCCLMIGLSLPWQPAGAQQNELPVIRASSAQVSIRENGELMRSAWRISPELKPDVHVVGVKGASTWVAFITDQDSIGYTVKPGDTYDFIILLNGKDSALTQIKGERFIPPAVFDEKYRKEHEGKTTTEIPEVYELVHLVIALAPQYAQKEPWAVERGNDYYKDLLQRFGAYRSDPLVLKMDTLLTRGWYATLKMDACAFIFDKDGKIVQSPVYDRVGWGKTNSLRPFIPELQSFAERTNFREFYRSHRHVYEAQIRAYRDSINTPGVVRWLNAHFPGTRYNAFKIIWSPLVSGNQSANWFESNGFRESQAHVNFPYPYWFAKTPVSKKAKDVMRGNIVFTEINHAFTNPEADKHAGAIVEAFPDKYHWVEKGKAREGYGGDIGIFNEYMNWGLVSLYYVDKAPKAEVDSLLQMNNRYMLRRGFQKFPEYSGFLVSLYRSRKKGQTIADLYPEIVAWFRRNSK